MHYKYNGTNQIDCVDANDNDECGDLGDGDRVSQTVGEVETTYVLDTATSLTMALAHHYFEGSSTI